MSKKNMEVIFQMARMSTGCLPPEERRVQLRWIDSVEKGTKYFPEEDLVDQPVTRELFINALLNEKQGPVRRRKRCSVCGVPGHNVRAHKRQNERTNADA